jgi:hypothetical protein
MPKQSPFFANFGIRTPFFGARTSKNGARTVLGPLIEFLEIGAGRYSSAVCVFITAGPMIKLGAGGEGNSEGHVL